MQEQSFSLTELNRRVRDAINAHLPETYWLRAEMSDVRRNSSGHCYLEFVEKNAANHHIVARARGTIWSGTYEILSEYFERETGQTLTSGLTVLVRVSVEFHELYGYSLSVVEIDPSFTIGEMHRNRQQIINQLKEDGILCLNQELTLSELPHRIAVISSPTAAGYEDFCDHLHQNQYGFIFYPKLFPAIMQGEMTESSVIAALEKIYAHKEHFDAIAVIRGGGSSSDLSCFDSYLLAANCAQFPLPIISGIGHERDITVVDAVAHTRAKTPTAIADFFISKVSETVAELMDLQQQLTNESAHITTTEKENFNALSQKVTHVSNFFLRNHAFELQRLSTNLRHLTQALLMREKHLLSEKEQYIRMVSPENILKRGYTLTLKDGKIIQSAKQLAKGDTIQTRFSDGKIESVITQNNTLP